MFEYYGIGIDIIDIKRFRKIPYAKNKRFYQRNFQQSEIDYCLKYRQPAQHFAGKFAIKESIIKAISEKIAMIDIEVSHVNSKPTIRLPDNYQEYSFLVSLSHEKDFAVAVVISKKA